jgi:hypothetical protein
MDLFQIPTIVVESNNIQNVYKALIYIFQEDYIDHYIYQSPSSARVYFKPVKSTKQIQRIVRSLSSQRPIVFKYNGARFFMYSI